MRSKTAHRLTINGEIERRLLVNYRVDPEAIARLLPAPFRPQLVGDAAVAGICLIRMGGLRPRGFPRWVGLRSENAAHRIAVEWDGPDGPHTGVYIPRRDTDSVLTTVAGGRLFPGEHHRATFEVDETESALRVAFSALDGTAEVAVQVDVAEGLSGSTLFGNVAQASAFFEQGSEGFSATRDPRRFALETAAWAVDAGTVTEARSSFFDDESTFPPGTATLDCALVMRKIPVTWKALASLHSGNPAPVA
jgi:hypothetical protein